MNELIYLKATTEKGSNENQMRLIASTEATDRDGESIKIDGWDTTNFKRNPVLLWAHDYRSLPIGKFVNIKRDHTLKALVGTIEWASFEANPFAQLVKQQFKEGIMSAFSVGFIPRKRNPENPLEIIEAELLEVSAVPVPANPEALALAFGKGLKQSDVPKITFDLKDYQQFTGATEIEINKLADFIINYWGSKGVVPYKKHPLEDKGVAWDGPKARKRLEENATTDEKIDFAKYGLGFGWFDGEKSDTMGAYKLPHHDIVDGKMVTIWRGVTAAMAALLGARGGTDLPSNDKKGVYNHLAKHYADFGEEAPEMRDYTPAELKELFSDDTKEVEEVVEEPISDDIIDETEKSLDIKAITDKTEKAVAALQDLLAVLTGSSVALGDGALLTSLSGDEKTSLRFGLKLAQLVGGEVLRRFNVQDKTDKGVRE
jgi:HK97 family phage prohead protease